MSGLVHRVTTWTWASEWRTWLAHFLIVGLLVLGLGLLGGRSWALAGGMYFIAYYHGREHLWEGGEYTRDRIMDAVSATAGGVLGYALVWGLA